MENMRVNNQTEYSLHLRKNNSKDFVFIRDSLISIFDFTLDEAEQLVLVANNSGISALKSAAKGALWAD